MRSGSDIPAGLLDFPESPWPESVKYQGRQDARYAEPPLQIAGDADRYNHRDGNDDYTQPGDLFRLMTPDQQQRLFKNVAAAMAGVPEEIVQRQLVHFHNADPAYAAGVSKALGVKNRATGKK